MKRAVVEPGQEVIRIKVSVQKYVNRADSQKTFKTKNLDFFVSIIFFVIFVF